MWTNPFYFIAFGFGSGLAPWMPGTIGTLMAIPFYLLLQMLPWQIYLIVVLLAFNFGIWICDIVEREIGIPDYSGIVFDEIVGLWCTLFMVPAKWEWIVMGFVLFRVFDIWKPWPIRWFNKKVPGGFGIMVDDLLAGVISCLILQIMLYLQT